jgi:hypothetical protein
LPPKVSFLPHDARKITYITHFFNHNYKDGKAGNGLLTKSGAAEEKLFSGTNFPSSPSQIGSNYCGRSRDTCETTMLTTFVVCIALFCLGDDRLSMEEHLRDAGLPDVANIHSVFVVMRHIVFA